MFPFGRLQDMNVNTIFSWLIGLSVYLISEIHIIRNHIKMAEMFILII